MLLFWLFNIVNAEMPDFSKYVIVGFTSFTDFGMQDVNDSLCIECGTCEKICPYGAITMDPKPVFDHDICNGCWACYNHCNQKAIFTEKLSGEFQYPKPEKQLVDKLEISY